jgi:hypothetical protein
MTNTLKNITDSLSDAALLEMGGDGATPSGKAKTAFSEPFEEYCSDSGFGEAAEYDRIHKAIRLEHEEYDRIHTDACRYDKKDACFAN